MANRSKKGGVLKFLSRRLGSKTAEGNRKLSEIIKEMGFRLLKDPDAAVSPQAVETVILLASAAWNAALGDQGLRKRHGEILGTIISKVGQPWPELTSTDTDGLISGLIEYKKTYYPRDRRRIVATEGRPNGNVRVYWVEDDNLVIAPFGSTKSNAATARAKPGRTIAARLVAKMKREIREKVVDIRSVIEGRVTAEELQKTVVTRQKLAAYHPAHAAYLYAQNQMSVMSELITSLDEMAALADIVAKAEDLYLPSGPPMSPLTASYFTCWAFFDLCAEPANETIGTIVSDLGAAFGMNSELQRLIRLMQESRMGIYIHEGTEPRLAILRDLITGVQCRAIVPAGYLGNKGEIWYARVLPPPIPGTPEHVVFTTPYIVLGPPLREWQAYFRRTIPDAPKQVLLDAYERHMKFGPTRRYWNDFVFEGYVNHTAEVIYLEGLPDLPESRPHSKANLDRFWQRNGRNGARERETR
ncbi:MAG TPA: hypothetical protein VI895_08565 [Bdellovibrionota bacterium]|nr:hypothetical protein [Bdellovibrionota bacterium]